MVVDAPQVEIEVEDITNSYVTFNVVLLSELEKYSEIYVFLDGKGHLVKDGQVTVDGLKSNVDYEFFVYGKNVDKYYDLGERKIIRAALLAPTEIEVSGSIVEKDGEKFIQLYYKVDNKQAIRTIDVEIAGKKYGTVSNTVLIPFSMDSFNTITNLEIKIVINTSEYIGQQTLIFTDFNKEFTLNFVIDEINLTMNDFVKGIFV